MILTFFTSKPESYRDSDPRYEIGDILLTAFGEEGFEDTEYDFNESGIDLILGDDTLEANSYEELPDNVKDALSEASKQIAELGYYCDLDEIIY